MFLHVLNLKVLLQQGGTAAKCGIGFSAMFLPTNVVAAFSPGRHPSKGGIKNQLHKDHVMK